MSQSIKFNSASPLIRHFATTPYKNNFCRLVVSFLAHEEWVGFYKATNLFKFGATHQKHLLNRYTQLFQALQPRFKHLTDNLTFHFLISYIAQHCVSMATGTNLHTKAPAGFKQSQNSYAPPFEVFTSTRRIAPSPNKSETGALATPENRQSVWIVLPEETNLAGQCKKVSKAVGFDIDKPFPGGEMCVFLRTELVDHQKGIINTFSIENAHAERYFLRGLSGEPGFPTLYLDTTLCHVALKSSPQGTVQIRVRDEFIMIQKFAEGGDLLTLLTESGDSLSLRQAFDLASKIIEAVRVLHCQFGVIHRDLTLQNIVLDANHAEPTIIDFGTAILKSQAHRIKSTMGNYSYYPFQVIVELSRGNGLKAAQICNTTATDIHSLGLVLGALLLNICPDCFSHPGGTPYETYANEKLALHKQGRLPVDLPDNDIGAFIRPMLQFDGAKRPSIETVQTQFKALFAQYAQNNFYQEANAPVEGNSPIDGEDLAPEEAAALGGSPMEGSSAGGAPAVNGSPMEGSSAGGAPAVNGSPMEGSSAEGASAADSSPVEGSSAEGAPLAEDSQAFNSPVDPGKRE